MLDPHSLSIPAFPWRTANSVLFLVDGDQFFPAMLDAIKQAKNYILMEMYLFESGTVSDQFIKAFSEASQRGIDVRLLLDDYGSLGLSKADKNRLKDAGVQIVFYNPLKVKKFKKNLFRTHRKYLIVDGDSAFVGGVGITDSFQGIKAWRETVIKIQGEVVADWQTLFVNNFKRCSGNTIPGLVLSNSNTKGIRARLAHTSGGSHLEIKRVLLNRMNTSRQIVWLASAYFVPSRKIRKALRKSAKKGKDVRLLLPGPISDHPAIRYASRRYYARLLRFGVRIFEFQGRFTHSKMVLIDDWFSIGSSNMDRWNFRWNLEANQEIDDKQIANEASRILQEDFENSEEIHYHFWVRRSWWQRMKEWLWGKVDLWLTK